MNAARIARDELNEECQQYLERIRLIDVAKTKRDYTARHKLILATVPILTGMSEIQHEVYGFANALYVVLRTLNPHAEVMVSGECTVRDETARLNDVTDERDYWTSCQNYEDVPEDQHKNQRTKASWIGSARQTEYRKAQDDQEDCEDPIPDGLSKVSEALQVDRRLEQSFHSLTDASTATFQSPHCGSFSGAWRKLV